MEQQLQKLVSDLVGLQNLESLLKIGPVTILFNETDVPFLVPEEIIAPLSDALFSIIKKRRSDIKREINDLTSYK